MTDSLKGGVVLITGAASGIGAALAVALAKRGCNLALADLNEAGLSEVAGRAAKLGADVSSHSLDVADAQVIAALPDTIKARHGRLSVLINNAGVALGGTFDQTSLDDFEWLMNINFWAVVRLSKAFLPMLRQEPAANIVNVSSLFGLIAPPGQAAYCSSKFAVRGFSESLRQELAGSPVTVTVVHPGGIATSIARNARFPKGTSKEDSERSVKRTEKMLKLSSDAAAERIVLGIQRREPRVLIGPDCKALDFLQRLFPVSYSPLLAPALSGFLASPAPSEAAT
jgi:short-subunit dehydrogenase